ncbi:glycosyltransferase family 1 protein [Xylariaceae sp. AK1471]|nr:glycosyltransferase family 1 protein [Xylariaceae sp. AK1471]
MYSSNSKGCTTQCRFVYRLPWPPSMKISCPRSPDNFHFIISFPRPSQQLHTSKSSRVLSVNMVVYQGQGETKLALAGTKKSPLLVFAAAPAAGHIGPPLYLAREMMARGYDVVFMSSLEFKTAVEKIGAEWYECSPIWPPGAQELRESIPLGLERTLVDIEHVFLSQIPSRSASMKALLEMVHERDPTRQVIILTETASMATLPFFYGAPLPRGYTQMPKTIGLNVVPVMVSSCDTAPFGPGLPPDSTESGRARNKVLHEMVAMGPFKKLDLGFTNHLKTLGCTNIPECSFFDSWFTAYDTLFQMCSPSMEYPRSDLPLHLRYAGALPPRPVDPDYAFPSWWSEVKEHAALPADAPNKKKIVVVAQGTVNTDHRELVVPTIKALAKREDIILVAILGVKDASLPAGTEIPPNTRVVDYLPYDPLLQMSDLFVMNGAYGAFVHAALNGVPVVSAGVTEDKLEASARIEYIGLGVNLRTQLPTSEAIADAADKILRDPKYKFRARRIQQDNKDLDVLHIVHKQIREYAQK